MTKTAEFILELLLKEKSWLDRREIIDEIKNNDIICFECGIGDRENPNPNCQCWNDE